MTDPRKQPESETLFNTGLVGRAFWIRFLQQFRSCYLTSLTSTTKAVAPAALIAAVGLVFSLSSVWFENTFPVFASQYSQGFWGRATPFLIGAVAWLLYLPMTEPVDDSDSKPLRYSLSSAFVILTIACVALAICISSYRWSQSLEEYRDNLTHKLQSHGNVFLIHYKSLSVEVRELRISGVNDTGMRALAATTELQNLVLLDLDAPKITDISLDYMESLRHLHELILIGASLSDERVNRYESNFPNCKVIR